MFFRINIKKITQATIAFLLAVIVMTPVLAQTATSDIQKRARLARLEAQQALDLYNRYTAMATEARELVYTLPIDARPDASRRADVLARSAERANQTYSRLSAYADGLDRQRANHDIAVADRAATTSASFQSVGSGNGAMQARADAREAKAYSDQIRQQMQEAKANLMAFDSAPGQVDPSVLKRTRDAVRSLGQEAKIAAWRYRDLDAKATALESLAAQ